MACATNPKVESFSTRYNHNLSILELSNISLIELLVSKKKIHIQNIMATFKNGQQFWSFTSCSLTRTGSEPSAKSSLVFQEDDCPTGTVPESRIPTTSFKGIWLQKKKTVTNLPQKQEIKGI